MFPKVLINSILMFTLLFSFAYSEEEIIENDKTELLFKACKENDNVRIKEAATKFFSEFVNCRSVYGLPASDPFIVDTIKATLMGFEITLRNNKFFGFREAKLVDATLGPNLQANLMLTANLVVKGDYEIKGMVHLPIESTGRYTIDANNLELTLELPTTSLCINGTDFWKIGDWSYDIKANERVIYKFVENDPEKAALAKMVTNYANGKSEKVFEELGEAMINPVLEVFINTVQQMYDHIPATKILLDYKSSCEPEPTTPPARDPAPQAAETSIEEPAPSEVTK